LPQQGTRVPPGPSRITHPIGERADELLARLRAAGDGLGAAELEDTIAQAIRESGVATVYQGAGEDNGVSLAVWSDDLSPWVGNPLPIETRLTLTRSNVSQAVGHLARAMARGGMGWGLLVYARSEEAPGPVVAPNIIHISAERFLELLRTVSFGDLV